ncbi:MAG: MalY/PatB family protein [Cellulosilyticaceae bacterium]
MTYDFDTPINRKNTQCFKWDAHTSYNMPQDAIPLWVADMDFASPKCITDALTKRTLHPIYGYTQVSDTYTHALKTWFALRHQWTIDLSWLVITQNIMSAIKTALSCFCDKGDYVLIQEPVYDNFKKSIVQCGLQPMINTLCYHQTHYTIDWESFEKQLAHPQVKLFILCNPHNPVGKVWTREDLHHIAALCILHNVLIISDEIHQDIVLPPHKHIPIASLSEEISQHVITCTSPAKVFNTPSLSFGNIIIPSPALRSKFQQTLNTYWSGNMSPFGQIIVEEGYSHASHWVDALTTYLQTNHQYLEDFCKLHMPSIHVTHAEATYLAWIDLRNLGLREEILLHHLSHKAKLWVHSGSLYGESGNGFIRMNLAISHECLQEVVLRLKAFYDSI